MLDFDLQLLPTLPEDQGVLRQHIVDFNNQLSEKYFRYFKCLLHTWAVTYGEDIVVGIAGFGETPELAFEDFVRSWKQLKGFEWIRKQPMKIKNDDTTM